MDRFYKAHSHDVWGLRNRLDLWFRSKLAQRCEETKSGVLARPSIPLVLVCALFMWGSCAIAYFAYFYASVAVMYCVLVASVLLVGVACFIALSGGRVAVAIPSIVFVAVLGAGLGLFCASLCAVSQHATLDALQSEQVKIVAFQMEEDARATSYGSGCHGKAHAYDEMGNEYSVRVMLSSTNSGASGPAGGAASSGTGGSTGASTTESSAGTSNSSDSSSITGGDLPLYGQVYSCTGTISVADDEYAQTNWQGGLCGTLRAYNVRRSQWDSQTRGVAHNLFQGAFSQVINVRKGVIEAIDAADGAREAKIVLCALLCGYRVQLYDTDTYNNFKIAGLAHLVAVSGAHLSLVVMLVGAVLRKARVRASVCIIVQSAFVCAFLIFAALPVSAMRAGIMTFAVLLSHVARRKGAPLNALGICILIMVGINPVTALSLSFALSALSVLGILLFARLMQTWFEFGRNKASQALSSSVGVTLSASLLSSPLSASIFCQLPLVSPLANLIAAPLFTIICALGFSGCALQAVFPVASTQAFNAAIAACSFLCSAVGVVAHIPYASVPFTANAIVALIITGVATFALWFFWPRLKLVAVAGACGLACVLAVCVNLCSNQVSGTQLVALNVGQGDSLLVKSENNAVLVDTGNEDQMLLAALARQGIYHLDAVIISHADDDHMGSLSALEGVVQIDRVIVCEFAKTCECKSCVRLCSTAKKLVGESNVAGVRVGNNITCGTWDLNVVWPDAFSDEGGNADSLTLLCKADADSDGRTDAKALLCGDCEDEQLDKMIESGKFYALDIYKVGHHGSKKAIDSETAQKIKPSIALVSVGKNSYGHPTAAALDALHSAAASIYRTDQSGDVTCNIAPSSITVSTQN